MSVPKRIYDAIINFSMNYIINNILAKPILYAIVIPVGLWGLYELLNLSTSTVDVLRLFIVILAAIIIFLYFIGYAIYRRAPFRYFARFEEAQPVIQEKLEQYLKQAVDNPNAVITIKIIGVALRFSWPVIRAAIDNTLKQYNPNNGNISFQIIMTDKSWFNRFLFGKEWSGYADATMTSIASVEKEYESLVSKDKLKFIITERADLPHQHGILINDKVLFRSYCQIKETQNPGQYSLTVGQNPYELFEMGKGGDTNNKIQVFIDLHKFYSVEKTLINSHT